MNVAEIIVTNRKKNKADQLKEIFNDLTIVEWGEVPHFDMIINATSLGLNTEDDLNLDLSKVGKNKLFYDVIYNPIQTNFLKLGQELGNLTINGKMMFIYQALSAFSLWHEIKPEINQEVVKLLD